MRKSEKSKLIKALSALVEKNGPEFPSEHPTEMVENAALSGIFDAAMRDDVTKEALVEEIERKCAFRKAFAEELAELCLSVYSAKELAGLKEKKGAQFEALCGLARVMAVRRSGCVIGRSWRLGSGRSSRGMSIVRWKS